MKYAFAVGLAALSLAGCSGEPDEPAPTPTPEQSATAAKSRSVDCVRSALSMRSMRVRVAANTVESSAAIATARFAPVGALTTGPYVCI